MILFGSFDFARSPSPQSIRKRSRSAVRAGSGARRFEPLEDRQMLSITLTPAPSSVVSGVATDPAGKTIVVPISGVDSNSVAIQYGTPTSTDPNISVSLVPVTNYVDLNITFTDSNNTVVTGDLVLALFGNSAPNTVAQIVSLVNQGKYNGETFGYVQDGFVAFAGYDSTGQNQVPQGSTLDDEFNQNLTFTSPGLLAMANAGPDSASSLFFITATDNPGGSTAGGTPVSLVNLPQALNNRFTIFGDLVGGFDVFEKLMTTPGTGGTPTNLVTINSATSITDNHDAVLMISSPAGYTGKSATINLPATDSDGGTANSTFTVNTVFNTADGTSTAAAVNDQPFLGPANNTSTPQNQAKTITLTAVDPQSLGVTFGLTETDSSSSVTITPNPATLTDSNGQASETFTVTPNTNFSGNVSLQASVITVASQQSKLYVDNATGVGNSFAASTNDPTADTQAFTLAVDSLTAPSAPTNLTATAIATNEVSLSWTAATGTVTGYNIFRGTTSGGESTTPLNSTPLSASATSFNDLTAVANTTYFYTVQAVNGTSASASSNEATATTPATGPVVPSAPTNLTAAAISATEIDLSWTAATGTVTGYNVFRGTSIGGESSTPLNSTPLSSTATSFKDTTATSGTTFFYVVKAVDSTAASASSNEATATTIGTTAPGAPVLNTPVVVSSTEIDLNWAAATGTVTGYNVFRGTTAGGESTTPLNSTPLSSSTTSFQDTTATAGTTFFYVVQAVNGSTTSPNSNEQSAIAASATSPAAPTDLTLDTTSKTGLITTDNYTSQATPILDATTTAGNTVTFSVNGKSFTATANSSGLAQTTLPAGSLVVGANSITATASNSAGSSPTSSALTVTYAPSYLQVYTVPGAIGSSQTLTINWTSRQAAYNDEIGVYEVSDATGTVDGIAPGAAGYDKAAIGGTADGGQFAQTVFASGKTAGATLTLNATGGELLAFYMIQNNTSANFLSKNPTNAGSGNNNPSQPKAFFTTTAANPDVTQHVQVTADSTTGTAQYAWEDLQNGDFDYNDVVMTVATSSGNTASPSTLNVPGTAGAGNVSLSATLASGTHDSTAPGDVGVYFVDNPTGSIGSLTPSSPGYLAAALASGNSQVLIPSGTANSAAAQSITIPAGKYIAFYAISSGTTANFLSANPSNGTATSGLPNAFLSFSAANPNQTNHFNFTSPEGVATDPTKTQVHVMDQVLGSASNFDDLDLDLSFTAG